MNTQTEKFSNEINEYGGNGYDAGTSPAAGGGAAVSAVRKGLSSALEAGRETYDHVRDKALESARAADRAVHVHPYTSIGVAFGLGFLFGCLAASR